MQFLVFFSHLEVTTIPALEFLSILLVVCLFEYLFLINGFLMKENEGVIVSPTAVFASSTNSVFLKFTHITDKTYFNIDIYY